MDRRKFLQTVAVGAGAVGAGSCAHLGSPLSMTHSQVLELVEKLKGQLDVLNGDRALQGIIKHLPAGATADERFPGWSQQLRSASRALLLAGSFHSMSVDVRAHPAVQKLMRDSLDEMATATQALHRAALDTTPEQRNELTKAFRDDPRLAEKFARGMDQEAATLGVSLQTRARLRALFHQAGNRMRQSTPLFIDEYGHKVARLEARLKDPQTLQRELMARSGDETFWGYQHELRTAHEAWLRQLAAAPGAEGGLTGGGYGYDNDTEWHRRRGEKDNSNAGAWAIAGTLVLGLGIVLFAGGLIGTAGTINAGAFVATAGAVLGILGLIILIAAAVKASS